MIDFTGLPKKTPTISDLQKHFYKTMLVARKEHILDHSMNLLRKREENRNLER